MFRRMDVELCGVFQGMVFFVEIVSLSFFTSTFSSISDPANKIITLENGGVEIVLQAMKRFPHVADVQKCACGILQNLSANSI